MIFKKSRKLYVHIDCDSFFANCEILRNPKLKNAYVCVGGDIIVACTYNCKKLGIKTGTPIWEAKKILKNKLFFFSCDHEYYSYISNKLFSFLQKNIEEIKPFSIDEAFGEISGIPDYFKLSTYDYLKKLQKDILINIGIPVSIGCSNTYIKAKIFSKINKPYGIYIGGEKENEFELFKKMEISKIPFIGKKYTEKLKDKAPKIIDFLKLGFWYLKKEIGKNATTLRFELLGISMYKIDPYKPPKSISKSRSFSIGCINDKRYIKEQLISHFSYIYDTLIEKNGKLKKITILFRTKDFREEFYSFEFQEHINNIIFLKEKLLELFYTNYRINVLYRSVGVIFGNIKFEKNKQMFIFDYFKDKDDVLKDMTQKIILLNKKYQKEITKFGTK